MSVLLQTLAVVRTSRQGAEMSGADLHEVTGDRLGDRAGSMPVSPGPLDRRPGVDDVMPLAPVDQSGEIPRSFLRRQPVRIVEGSLEGGYTSVFEVICCDCGDDPYLDYREVSPRLQRIRGPYPLREGCAAYGEHTCRGLAHPGACPPGESRTAIDG
jgi:hypothetical protein